MKIIVAVCLLVGVINAAEVDFKQNSNQNGGSRPISVPVIPRQSGHQIQRINSNSNKRQLDVSSGSRPSITTGTFRQQQASGVPLQQPFRPSPQSARQAVPAAPSRPDSSEDNHENPAQQRSNPVPVDSFVDHKQQQAFVPFARESVEGREDAPVRRPARPSAVERFRPTKPEAPSSRGNPEFERGFPDGFTNGLPTFDFQGRMPEPDEKSDGFMDRAQSNFPNLKAFGGFDAMPDVAREDSVGTPVKRISSSFQGNGRPNGGRPSSQEKTGERHIRDTTRTKDKSERTKPLIINDDEAMLEPDLPLKANKKRGAPTDIADIIAEVEAEAAESSETDSHGSEQRFNPSFFPNAGPYGGPFQSSGGFGSGRHNPPSPPLLPNLPPPATVQPRRPPLVGNNNSPAPPPPAGPVGKSGRPFQRTPTTSQYDTSYEDNNILGSGNFQVITGGIFSDPGVYKPFNNYFSPPPSNHLPSHSSQRHPSNFHPFQNKNFQQPQSPFQQPLIQSPPVSSNTPSTPTSSFYQTNPASFFGGGVDEFFSNFRDFADVNQDYRN